MARGTPSRGEALRRGFDPSGAAVTGALLLLPLAASLAAATRFDVGLGPWALLCLVLPTTAVLAGFELWYRVFRRTPESVPPPDAWLIVALLLDYGLNAAHAVAYVVPALTA